jgi:UDP-N-acetylmuramoyl-L-alanyl-D-glutamate--2,6-diaminopimelate ligase
MMAQRIDAKGLLLSDLLAGVVDAGEFGRTVVTGVALDSRDVEPGDLFLAVSGTAVHGMRFFDRAVEAGASVVLAEPAGDWGRARLAEMAATSAVPLFMVSELGKKAGMLAARFFGQPAHAMRVIGVTGTNGKTSVTHFLASALATRVPAGIIGTLGNGVPGELQPATHTTPDAVSVQAELARQQQLGVKALAMEVSSHALDQGRVAGVPFHTAVFTNLSRDHQDYHGSMQAYAEAKARLFQRNGLMLAVINVDDPVGAHLLNEVSQRTQTIACGTTASTHALADRYVHARSIEVEPSGIRVDFDSSWGAGVIRSPLLGRFNAENLLLTLGVLLGWDMSLNAALDALRALQPVDGRMSVLGGDSKPRVVIDYAHTPDALEKVLSSLREHVPGRLVCVFGCGGDRDRGKRPLMGAVAARLADEVVLTDDNPRGEDGQEIIEQILQGMRGDDQVQVQRDRARAIAMAIAGAAQDDLVLVAGKGHEDYQLVGDLKLPFSDFEQVERALMEYSA